MFGSALRRLPERGTAEAENGAGPSILTNGITEASALFPGNNQSSAGISAALVSPAPEISRVANDAVPDAGSTQIGIHRVDVAVCGDARAWSSSCSATRTGRGLPRQSVADDRGHVTW